MSVIIKLQNLPWSANALDIRQFFRGLSIPEGGVHIVGGEQGDAFIAFSTDEDARQAMMADGGKIKEVKIKLMLSSRTEMQKVIEAARQQSMSLHSFMQMPTQPLAPVQTTMSPLMGPLRGVGALSSVTTPAPASMGHTILGGVVQPPTTASPINNSSSITPGIGGGLPLTMNKIQESLDERKDSDSSNRFRDRKERSRSRESDRRRDRDRDRDRDRHRDRERDRRPSRRDRSRSRDRRRNRRDRSRSRDRTSKDRGRSMGRDIRRETSTSRGSHSDDDKEKENDVILVGQYPSREAMEAAHKAAKGPVKQLPRQAPTPPTNAAVTSSTAGPIPNIPPVSEPSLQGFRGNNPPLAQQAGLRPSLMSGTSGPISAGLSSLSRLPTPSRSLQLGGAAAASAGGPEMNIHTGSGFPREFSRFESSGDVLPSGVGSMSEAMQGSSIHDSMYPGGATTAASLRSRESWPPSRTPSEMSSRFAGRDRMTSSSAFPMKQDMIRGSNNFDESLEDFDREDFDSGMGQGFRGTARGSNFRGSSMDFRRGLDSRIPPRSVLGPNGVMERMAAMHPQASDILDRRTAGGIGGSTYQSQFRGEPDYPHHRDVGSRFGGVDPYDRPYMNERPFGGRSGYPMERFPNRDRFAPTDRGYEPRAPQNVQSGTCVEIRHMPPEAGIIDIRKFFNGMFLANNSIKIINDNHGNRVGIAYVKFSRLQDKEVGMHFTGKTIRGSLVEVLHLDDDIFDKAIDSYKPTQDPMGNNSEFGNQEKQDPANQFVCLSVQGLPPYVKEEDIFNLFRGFNLVEVVIAAPKGLKKELEAFVKFSKHEDAKKALHAQMKYMMGHKILLVNPCTVEQLQEARKLQDDFDDDVDMMGQQDEPDIPEKEPPAAEKPEPKIASPPKESKNTDPVAPEEPAVEPEEQETAPVSQATSDCILLKGLPIQANDRDILDFFSDVGLVPLRIHIMLDKFGKPTGDAFCEFPSMEEASKSLTKHATPLGKQDVHVIAITRAEMNEALGIPPIQPELINDGTMRQPMFGGAGRNLGRVGLLGESPGSMGGQMPVMGSKGPVQDNPVEGFGKPGCVLSLDNIPFRADIEEILEFFRGFDVSRDSVIRRFSDRGLPMGEARVALRSPGEAQRALRELRNCRMRSRPIFMRIL